MVTEADFRAAVLPFTLHEEGGLSLDRADKGNWTGGAIGKGELRGTRYGISAAAHPALDIRHLTLAEACDLYWRDYCVKPGFDRITLPLLQVVFDAGVNCGTARAKAWLVEARREATLDAQIKAVSAARLAHCRSLPTWSRYRTVWSGRIARCQAHALALAAAAPIAVAPKVSAPAIERPPTAPKANGEPVTGLVAWIVRTLVDAFLTQTEARRA